MSYNSVEIGMSCAMGLLVENTEGLNIGLVLV